MLNWAQPYQLSPGQYGHPQGWPNQYQGQSSYSHGYASAPSNCINVQQNSVIQQEKVNNPPCYNVPIANRFTPLSSEQFPALSCESDDEIRAVANPYDVEGAKRQTEMPRLGQIQNFGRKRRAVSPGSNKSYILETKRQNIDKLPKQEFSNVNIPTAEQFATRVEIEVINKGEVLPPDFDLVKFFKVLLTSHKFEFDVMRGRFSYVWITFDIKTPLANITPQWLFTGLGSRVYGKNILVTKTLLAYLTIDWLFISVDYQ
ncbi:hypothetical protein QYM36_008047 [Artemia franciscana]|uniref:Uncharacterized protein n=1 Tax=Artemia franciscana TaxID=6661 RepID=A0AA88IVK6_ARTSF|nr:hypothetical protein QYM36_008047 [Artemia franciscana]